MLGEGMQKNVKNFPNTPDGSTVEDLSELPNKKRKSIFWWPVTFCYPVSHIVTYGKIKAASYVFCLKVCSEPHFAESFSQ